MLLRQKGMFSHKYLYFRYISIFVLKNPLAYFDDLWSFLICTWVTLSSLIIQFVLDFVPGKLSLNYFICTGKEPALFDNEGTKMIRNLSIFCTSLVLILIYVVVSIKIAIFKNQNNMHEAHVTVSNFSKKPLADYLVVVTYILFTIVNVFLLLKIQSINMNESHIFPNNVLLYYLHLGLLPVFSLFFISIYFIRNRNIRDAFYRQMKLLFFERN